MGLEIFRSDVFVSPSQMIDMFEEYISWCEKNTLKECKLYGGEGEVAQVDKMRMPTIQGFMYYMRTTSNVLKALKNQGGQWEEAFLFIEHALHAISIEGAAAGLLKEALVIRKLGLTDKSEVSEVQVRRVVVLHTPDNGRAQIEDAHVELLE